MPDCPTPGQCPHEGAIAAMRQQDAAILELMRDLKDDMRQVKAGVETIKALERDHLHHREAIGRAFERIERVEGDLSATRTKLDAFLNQVSGMKQVAWALWTVLAGGLGLVIYKLFIVVGAV